MRAIIGRIVASMPVATFLYIMLIAFAGLNFDVKWLAFAMALDVADWIITEMT